MIAQGHREADLWEYSFDKLNYLAALMEERLHRDAAQEDLRQTVILRTVIGSCLSEENEGAFRTLERDLKKAAGLVEKTDGRAAAGALVRRLSRKK